MIDLLNSKMIVSLEIEFELSNFSDLQAATENVNEYIEDFGGYGSINKCKITIEEKKAKVK